MTISMKRLALAGGVAVSAFALSATAHAEGWTGGYLSLGVSGASSSADVSASSTGNNSLVVNNEALPALVALGTDTTADKLVFAQSGSTTTWNLSDGSAAADVVKHVLDIKSSAAGRATNRFRAGLIIEGGYDYEIGSGLVLGLNASYNFSGTANSEDVSGIGSADYTTQSGTLKATGTTTASPVVKGTLVSGTGATYKVYDLTSAGTFVPASTGTGAAEVVTPAASQNYTTVGTNTRFSMGDNWTIGARAGYAASSNILLFVAGRFTQAKVGLAAASTVLKETAAGKNVDLKSVSGNKWKDGYYLGGGFEAKVTNNISLKAEYRYADYGSYSITGAAENVAFGTLTPEIVTSATGAATKTVATLSAPVTTTVSAKNIQSHALRVSVAYRF